MDKIIIRKAKSEDIEKIANIKVRCWQIAYRNIIADEYLDNMDIEYTIEKNKRIFEQYNIIVAELKNEVIGFCRYDYNNYYEEENVDCELIALYIKPEMKRHGIGRKLMKYAINEFKNSKKEKMILLLTLYILSFLYSLYYSNFPNEISLQMVL